MDTTTEGIKIYWLTTDGKTYHFDSDTGRHEFVHENLINHGTMTTTKDGVTINIYKLEDSK